MTGKAVRRTNQTEPIRVAIIDDHRIITEGLATHIRMRPDEFLLVGTAGSVAELPALLRGVSPAMRPHAVLVDARLPDGSGLDILWRLRGAWSNARLLLFTGLNDPGLAEAAIEAGADGLLRKEVGFRELLDLVRRAHVGEVLFPSALMRRLARSRRPSALAPALGVADLTPRETQALSALINVGDPDEAAASLGVAPGTFRNHLGSAQAKLGAQTRIEAVSIALRCGVIRPPSVG